MARTSSARTKILVVFLCAMLFAQREGGGGGSFCKAAGNSRLWPVGDGGGWSAGVMGWPNYKPFKAGDVLLFHYKRGAHNVVQVSVAQHALCEVPAGNATVWSSGDDRVALARGVSFFISGFPGDCERGMRIAVTAR